MKKVLVILSVLITSCVTPHSDTPQTSRLGASIIKAAVDHQCRSELNGNSTYQMVSVLMNESQKLAIEDKVCGCVSEKAPEHLSLQQLGQVVMDSQERPRIVTQVVSKTLSACATEMISNWHK